MRPNSRAIALVCAAVLVCAHSPIAFGVDQGIVGLRYHCAFPNTPRVDGYFHEPVWVNAPWHLVDHRLDLETVGRLPLDEDVAAAHDRDLSYKVALVADADFLYVAMKVIDDVVIPAPVAFQRPVYEGCAHLEGIAEAPVRGGFDFDPRELPEPLNRRGPAPDPGVFTALQHDHIAIGVYPPGSWPDGCLSSVSYDVRRDMAAWTVTESGDAAVARGRSHESQAAMVRTRTGYQIEVAIPFSDVWPWSVTPAEDRPLSLLVDVMDGDSQPLDDLALYERGLPLWDTYTYRLTWRLTRIQGDYYMSFGDGQLHFVNEEIMAPSPSTARGGALDLRRGLNLVHVPARVDGIAAAGGLYAALGGLEDVSVLLAPGKSGQYLAYTAGVAAGSRADFAVEPYSAVFAMMRRGKSVRFEGADLSPVIRLHRGINQIGIPRQGAIHRVGELYDMSPAVVSVIRHAAGDFVAVVSEATDAVLEPGVGYIVVANDDVEITLDGHPWLAQPPIAEDDPWFVDPLAGTAPARLIPGERTGAPLMVAVGRVLRRDSGEAADGVTARVLDVASGASATDIVGETAGTGQYQVTFFDPARRFVAGDVLEVTFTGDGYGDASTRRVTLSARHIRDGVLSFGDVMLTSTPQRTALIANYPNPFNPETWIPFDLSAATAVTITVYGPTGERVRQLSLGELSAGSYRSRQTAAHWDGRNASGEPVASGTYVYELRAGSYRETRRMVILK